MAVPYLACMALVASIYHLPPRVLPAIQAVEGGAPGIVSHNRNGTDDFGVMQINTIWLDPLARYTGLPAERVRQRLVEEPCFNIAAAGAIMEVYLRQSGGDMLKAIGNYHSHTPVLHEAYLARVVQSATRLFVASPRSTTRE